METVQKICLVITIIGGILWGLVGLFDLDLKTILGSLYMVARIIYILVGITSLVNIGLLFNHIETK